MNNTEVVHYKQRLDYLFSQVEAFGDNPELLSHWARYLCVLVSGFLESSIQAIYAKYAKGKSAPYVANYVDSKLRAFHNPKMEIILQIAGAFNPQWRDELDNHTRGEMKDSVNSIVNNRHQIVHGVNVGITLARIRNYYENAVKVVKLIDEQCNRGE